MAEDGRVEINTAIDSSGITAGIQQIVAKLEEVNSTIQRVNQTTANAQTEAQSSIAKTADKIKSVSEGFKSTGDTLTKFVSLPIAGFGAGAIKMSTDLNAAMANVATLIPNNVKRIQELKSNVQDMSMQFGKSSGDIADGLYQVISTFGDTSDTSKILADNVKAAAAGMATTTDAINLTAAVSKGYNDTSETTIKHITDLAFQTANLGITTFPELSKSIGGVTPLAATLGIKMEDMFAVFATGSGITGDTSQVATQFQNILQSLMAPTTAMSALMKKLGYANGEAMLKSLGLQGTINKIVDTAKAANQPLQNYIGSIDGQTLALALNGNLAKGFTDNLKAMQHVSGSTDAAFKQQTQGVNKLGFEWNQAKQKGSVFMQTMGDAMAPVLLQVMGILQPFSKNLSEMANTFTHLSTPMKEVVMGFVAFAVAIGPILSLVGRIGLGISTLLRWFGPLITFVTEAGGIIPALGVAFTALTGPIGLTILAITGLVTVGILLYTHWGQVKAWLSNLWNGIKSDAAIIWGAITNFFKQWGLTILSVMTGGLLGLAIFIFSHWNQIKAQTITIFNSIGQWFVSFWNGIKAAFAATGAGIAAAARAAWTGVINGITAVLNGFKAVFVAIWNGIKAVFYAVIAGIVQGALNFWNNFGASIQLIFMGIKDWFSGWWIILENVFLGAVLLLWDIVTGNFTRLQTDAIGIWNNIKGALGTIWNGIQDIFIGVWTALEIEWTNIWTAVQIAAIQVWSAIQVFLIGLWGSIQVAAIQAWSALTSAISNGWDAIKNGTMAALSWLKGAIPAAWDAIKNAVVSAANSIKDGAINAWNNIKNGVMNVMSNLKSAIPSAWENIKSSVINAAQSIWTSVTSTFSNMYNSITSWMNRVPSAVKGGFNSAISFLRGINLYDIGVNIIEGLVNGIGSMFGAIKDKIASVANAIPAGIRKILHINSPSRVMADDVGQWIPAGLAQGIDKNMDVVTRSTNKMAQKAIPIMPQTLIQQNKQIMQVKTAAARGSQPLAVNLITGDSRVMAQWMIDDVNDLLNYKNGRAKAFKQS